MGDTIKIGNLDINSFKVGSTDCSIYLGDVKLYPQTNLPYDAEIEYLESDGSAYIDTGISASSTLRCELDFAIDSEFSFANLSFLFGVFVSSNTTYSVAIPSESQIRVPSGVSFTNVNCGTFGTSRHTISYKFGEIIYDGVKKSNVSGVLGYTNYKIRLFGRDDSDIDEHITGNFKLYSFTMVDDMTAMRDYIPVRVGNTGYMYDKVSGQLFGNAGTGNFILGNDVR